MTAPEDVNVDELRRRARRRLVGAIVLALAAAVFVPMLLESDPRPLGDDVAVRIPPVDDGKFVNRLTDKGKPDSSKPAAIKSETRLEPPKPESMKTEPPKSEAASASPQADAPKAEATKMDAPKAEAPKVEAPKVEPAAIEPAAAPKAAAPETEPKSPAPTKMAANSTASPAPASADAMQGFSVQLAAFKDNYGANALSGKLKKAGYPAYTEPLSTSKGTLWRVRVGPYPSRDAAASARDKLKGDGYDGLVQAAK